MNKPPKKWFSTVLAALAAMVVLLAGCGNETLDNPGDKVVEQSESVIRLGHCAYVGHRCYTYLGIDGNTVRLSFTEVNDDRPTTISFPANQWQGLVIKSSDTGEFEILGVFPGKLDIRQRKLVLP